MSTWQFWGTNKKRWLYLGFALFGIATITGSTFFLRRSLHHAEVNSKITQEVWEMIEYGMSKEQVINLIGDLPGAYNTNPIIQKIGLDADSKARLIVEIYHAEIWTGDNGEILVCFDENEVVCFTFYQLVFSYQGYEPNIVKRLFWTIWKR